MLAAQTFNARRGNAIPTAIFGVVTTGSLTGRFLRLDRRSRVTLDRGRVLHSSEVERIVGILVAMVARRSRASPKLTFFNKLR